LLDINQNKIPYGGEQVTIFDLTGATVYPVKPNLNLKYWRPFNLYIEDIFMDWMRTNNKVMSIYYNDYTWYKN
jgi:hypothetical protein